MSQKITQVDAFAERPFAGNPAAVCILHEPRDERWMQSVALEMNLPETAFLQREGDGFRLRWFTPTVEVDLCGHATLASAHVLWEQGELGPEEQARFYTRSGLLTAERRSGLIELNFPAEPAQQVSEPQDLAAALGISPLWVGRNRMDYLVEVAGEEQVRNLKPDFALLRTLGGRGVMVTSQASTGPYDFVSRFFGPATGIDEDPVTGSAHCCLGPFWGERLGKTELLGYQASARGGAVRVRLSGERVYLGGQAVTTLRGELLV
jgi:PhzF family phenazine biosynthesis protein